MSGIAELLCALRRDVAELRERIALLAWLLPVIVAAGMVAGAVAAVLR